VAKTIKIVREKYADYSVEDICDEEKIFIRQWELEENIFGFYLNAFDVAVIGVRNDLTLQERREVIAHELFHHFDQPLHSLLADKGEQDTFLNFYMKKDENRADMFAAMLTCPDISDCGTVAEIMHKYDCSKATAKLRRKIEEQSRNSRG
jgi:Zn-dependent peptidase ImmA (M78 family)